jgi:hypothetical protein
MPRANISDQHGRAFEYAIAATLGECPNSSLSSRATRDQERDKVKYGNLPDRMKQRFARAAKALVLSLSQTGHRMSGFSIDRLPDDAAKKGDVTDIRLEWSDGKTLNLSIKNNHHALKHQRPPSLMQQLGYPKKHPMDIKYRSDLSEVFAAFYRSANEVAPSAVNFRDVNAIQLGFVDNYLYSPVCGLAARYLAAELKKPQQCKTFFAFLVGRIDYVKVILKGDALEITDFSAIELPTECKVSQEDGRASYIYLNFNNGWALSLRLHTASSKMGKLGGTPSTKFDTQPVKMPLKMYRVGI